MNSSEASDSSLDRDDSTVSSKSNRNRQLDDVNGDGNTGGSAHQVADFSDMPSLASYRGDEASLASTLWTDCDQSLPSLSSYRTKDMSVASGSTRRSNLDKPSNKDEDSDGSGTERTRGNMSTSGRNMATPIESIDESQQNAVPSSSPSRDPDVPVTAGFQISGDSMPRLPTRRPMDDSVRSGSRQSDSESDSESEMTDDSPDVSIDTDEENDDEVDPAHGPSHIVTQPTRQLSPQSPKSPLRVNGVLPDVANPPLRVDDGRSEPAAGKEKSKTAEDGMSPGEPEPPAIIATPPAPRNSSKSAKKKSPKRNPKKSPRKKKVKDKDKDKEKNSTQPQAEIVSPGIVEEKGKRWKQKRSTKDDTKKTTKAPDRSASGNDTTRFFGKKNQSDKSHGVRRANSEMASVLDSIKPEEEKKRGILKRFSSSLKQMVRPSKTLSGTLGSMTMIPSGGKKRSKLKKLSTKTDNKQKTANA